MQNIFIHPTEPSDAARELYLYMPASCAKAWAQAEHYFRNLERKRTKGTYDAALARKGMLYAVETAAKEYVRDHGGPGDKWHTMFTPADRAAVAHLIMTDTETEWTAGNSWTA